LHNQATATGVAWLGSLTAPANCHGKRKNRKARTNTDFKVHGRNLVNISNVKLPSRLAYRVRLPPDIAIRRLKVGLKRCF
jgi:hypothetical protein